MNLYEIANEYQILLDQTFDSETGEINETALACLDKVADDMKHKGVAIASYIRNIEAEEEAIEEAIKRMEARKNQLLRKTKSLVDYLQSNMERCAISEISCPYFVIKLKKCPVSIDVINESEIPSEYLKVKKIVSVDKVKIKEELQAGVCINGVALKQNMRLEIK